MQLLLLYRLSNANLITNKMVITTTTKEKRKNQSKFGILKLKKKLTCVTAGTGWRKTKPELMSQFENGPNSMGFCNVTMKRKWPERLPRIKLGWVWGFLKNSWGCMSTGKIMQNTIIHSFSRIQSANNRNYVDFFSKMYTLKMQLSLQIKHAFVCGYIVLQCAPLFVFICLLL